MKNCPHCSAEIAENANFCVFCMKNLSEKTIIKPKKILNRLVKRLSACILALLIILSSAFSLYRPNQNNTPQLPADSDNYTGNNSQSGAVTPNNTTKKKPDEETKGGLSGFLENLFGGTNSGTQETPDETVPPNTSTNTPPTETVPPNTSTNTPPTEDSFVEGVLELKYEPNVLNTECVVTGIADGARGDTVEIPETYNGARVVGIANNAFYANLQIRTVHIPPNIKRIGELAFAGCKNITNLTLSEGIEELAPFSFNECTSLKEISLPSTINKSSYSVFEGCTALEKIESKCPWERSLSNYKAIRFQSFFENCTSLKTVTVPEGTQCLSYSIFEGCTALETVILPSSVKAIEYSAFKDCINLKNINLENVGFFFEEPFENCQNLTHLTIGTSSTRERVEIYPDTFKNCQRLKSITLPKNIRLSETSFNYCISLTDIYFMGTMAEWNALDFIRGNYKWISGIDSYTLHCTDGDIKIQLNN